MPIEVINPATGVLDKSYELMNQSQVDNILSTMEDVRATYVTTSWEQRRQLMQKVADLLEQQVDHFAAIITREMGKPITQAIAEVNKCAVLCRYYAEQAQSFLQDDLIKTDHSKSYRCYRPLGIIFAIMPWNFPLWQVMRFAVPNLMLGNAGVLSHAPNSTGIGLAIEQLFVDAGFPAGLFRSLVIDVDLAPWVIHHPLVKGVTLTGSERAGKAVASEAAQALKKVVLELGGSDPYVILADADLEHAAEQCILSRLNNAGQVCISAKRIIVVEEIKDQFEALILEKAKRYVAGDPTDSQTTLGPMARTDLRDQLHDQVQRCIEAGAHCLLGGQLPDGPGYYYPATVLTHIKPDSPACREELFGPVICLISAKDEGHALTLANDTIYGLGAAVFTKDLSKGEHIAANILNAGTCNVNMLVGSDPRLPFGGIGASGYGRELAREGLHEFSNIKTVVVR